MKSRITQAFFCSVMIGVLVLGLTSSGRAETEAVVFYTEALSLEKEGYYDTALLKYKAAREKGAPADWALYHEGLCLEKLGRENEAIELMARLRNEYAEDGPFSIRALETQAALLSKSEQYKEAASVYLLLADEDPKQPDQWLYYAGEEYLNTKEFSEAYRVLLNLMGGFPGSGFAHRAFLRIEEIRRLYPEKIPEQSDYESLLQGKIACEQQDYLSALDVFERLEDRPVDSRLRDDILYYHGLSLLRTSQYEEALSQFRQLRGDFPTTVYYDQSLNLTVECYIYLGEGEVALTYFDHLAEQKAPSSLKVLWGLAQYEEAQDHTQNALTIYNHLVSRAGEDSGIAAQSLLRICRIHAAAGQERHWLLALSQMEGWFFNSETHQEALYERARYLQRVGRITEAFAAYADLLGIVPPGYFQRQAVKHANDLAQLRYPVLQAEEQLGIARELLRTGRTVEALRKARGVGYAYAGIPVSEEAKDLADTIQVGMKEERWIQTNVALSTDWEENKDLLNKPPWDRMEREIRKDTLAFLAAAGCYDEAAEELRFSRGSLETPAVRRLRLEALYRSEQKSVALRLSRQLLNSTASPWDWDFVDTTVEQAAYPLAEQKSIRAAADSFGIDPLFLTAVIREESGFDPLKISPDRQRIGLMQLDPLSAQWLADRAWIKNYSIENLFLADTNTLLGAFYLKTLLDKYEGDKVMTLAAYHGGEGNVDAWHLTNPSAKDEAFLALIPFPETRSYVRNVLGAYWHYQERSPRASKNIRD